MANGNDSAQARLDALSGGAPLPQAGTMAIARRLLGPDLAQRYGDVIGAREKTVHDVARDFAIGALSGDPFKADAVKSQMVRAYNDDLRKEEAAARARDQENRAKLGAFFDGLAAVRQAPEEAQSSLLKHVMRMTTGDDPDPTTLKLLLADDKKALNDFLSSPDIYRTAEDDPETALSQITAVSKDPILAQRVVDGIQKMKQQHEETQKTILEQKKIKAGLRQPANSLDSIRQFRLQGEEELRRRALGEASADVPSDPKFAGVGDDELRNFVLEGRQKPGGASSRSPLLDRILGGSGLPIGRPELTSTPGVTIRRKGLPQAAPAAAAPAAVGLPQAATTPTTTAVETTTPTTGALLE